MKVPFNDLSRINEPLKLEVLNKLETVIKDSEFVLNQDIKQFEEKFAKFTKQKFSVSCANGTDALELILRSLNIGNNDEVIVPVNSYIATSFAVDNVGAKPVFVDNDEYYLIDVKKIESKITKNTRAIIGVNLYGQMCNTTEIKKLCKKFNIYFIEDAAQSHGATQSNFNVGDNSIAAAYSFYPGKNLGAWGDGGAVTTNSLNLYKRMLKIRNFGSKQKYFHEIKGGNTRLQPLQGIVLTKKLDYLNEWTEERNYIANRYKESFENIEKIKIPKVFTSNSHVWHLFVIEVPNRRDFINFFNQNGIETIIHYPFPIIKQKAYKNHSQKNEIFDQSFSQYKKIVTLPIFPKMTNQEQDYVIKMLRKYFK